MRKSILTLSFSFLTRDPPPPIRTRCRHERLLVALPRNRSSMNEDLVSSTAMASHLLLSILPSKSLRRTAVYFSDDGSPHRDSIIFPP
ncbi:hypothetical protein F2Q70_00020651 [Brassica cretica]|uniref:Uncharacterized protein n=1 Tax=Brassica cretica TaxID=69181 RepID=A0A8S9GHM0_BRACR|nr:hypothetical protein F2Q70_00020651 [Brassica cretica]